MDDLLPPPPPPPPAVPFSSSLTPSQENDHHHHSHAHGCEGFNQSYSIENSNLLPSSDSNPIPPYYDSDLLQQTNLLDPSLTVSFDSTSFVQHLDQYCESNPSEWMPATQNGQSPTQEDQFQLQFQLQHPDQNYLPEAVEDPIQPFDTHNQFGSSHQENRSSDTPHTSIRLPDSIAHDAFSWRGKTHPLEPEELGLRQGEEEEPNYFTKNLVFTPEEKRMIIQHLASRGPSWERKVKGFKVCEDLLAMNPRHTKFSYNNFLRRSMTEEAATATLRRAVLRAQVLMGVIPPETSAASQPTVSSTSNASEASRSRDASNANSASPPAEASTSASPLPFKKRNPFTASDVDQIIEYVATLPEFPSIRFSDTICTELEKLNSGHTKSSYSSFLKDNTFGKGRKLEDLIASRRSQLRRQKRREEEGESNPEDSDEEVQRTESQFLQGLFRPTSVGIIRRRTRETVEREETQEMGTQEEAEEEEDGQSPGLEREKSESESAGAGESSRKRGKSNPKSSK